MHQWSLTSWHNHSYQQAAQYSDQNHLNRVVEQLSQLPPLVTHDEANYLKLAVASAGRGEAFILQGGDCAESFNDCRAEIISSKLKILLQMSLILLKGMRRPIIRIGRIAGQYAKPRSNAFETINGVLLPSYRGDMINSPEKNRLARTPNPELLLKAYTCSAMTLNFIRALSDGGFADIHYPQRWDLDFVKHSKQADEYHAIVHSIADSLDPVASIQNYQLNNIDFFTSHEALHLHYEQALTRKINNQWYLLSTHLPWI